MSRVDEALARLQAGVRPEPPRAPMPLPTGETQFVAEETSLSLEGSPGEGSADVPDAPANRLLSHGPVEMKHPADREKLALRSSDAASTEQYRRIATRLHLAQAEQGTRVVMVTSALPGEGKTLTATNLALTLAESYRRQVLLIDGDLRRPSVHELLQLPNVDGLNADDPDLGERPIPLLRLTEHLTVLTAGTPDHNPMTILSSRRMKRVLEEARAGFEWVIVDTPPVGLLSDAHVLSALVDTVLLVVQAGATPLPAINTAIGCLGRDRIFGVVLNRADDGLEYDSYQKYYYADKTA